MVNNQKNQPPAPRRMFGGAYRYFYKLHDELGNAVMANDLQKVKALFAQAKKDNVNMRVLLLQRYENGATLVELANEWPCSEELRRFLKETEIDAEAEWQRKFGNKRRN